MIMTSDDSNNCEHAETCHKCNKKLGSDTVRDPCRLTGEFRGAAHNTCNVNVNNTHFKNPVFFPYSKRI